MREAIALLEPTIDARDVLESFLADRVLVEGWKETLDAASARFGDLGTRWADQTMTRLGRDLTLLAAHGLADDVALAESVAADIARLLEQVNVPGLPSPDDNDWRF